MSENDHFIKTETSDWAAYSERTKKLLADCDLSQAQLAVRIAASPSWVTQFLNGKLRPSAEKADALEYVLGIELRAERPDLPVHLRDVGEQPNESAIKALYHAGLIKVLEALSYTHAESDVRDDLRTLSRRLESTVTTQSFALPFSINQRNLKPIDEIAEHVDLASRLAVFTELALMKIDSSLQCGIPEDKRIAALQNIAYDLDLHDQWKMWEAGRLPLMKKDRPAWSSLPSIGGVAGFVQAKLQSTEQEDLLLLHGSDIFGWLGLDYIAGRWLVNTTSEVEAALFSDSDSEPEQRKKDLDREHARTLLKNTFLMAEAIGPDWLQVECQKLCMFYYLHLEKGKKEVLRNVVPAIKKLDLVVDRLDSLIAHIANELNREKESYIDKARRKRRDRYANLGSMLVTVKGARECIANQDHSA